MTKKINKILFFIFIIGILEFDLYGKEESVSRFDLDSSLLSKFRSEARGLTIAVSKQEVKKAGLIDIPLVRGIGNFFLSDDEIASIIRVVDKKDLGTVVVVQPLGFSIFWIFSYQSKGDGFEFFIFRKLFEDGAQPDNLRFEILDDTVISFSIIS